MFCTVHANVSPAGSRIGLLNISGFCAVPQASRLVTALLAHCQVLPACVCWKLIRYAGSTCTPENEPAAGTLTFVSGTGSTTALTYSAAVSGLATGFTFALTVSDTNLQDWNAVGLPKGLVPTANQSFVAAATGAGASTGTVYAPGISGITSIEVIGDPNQSIAPQPQGGTAQEGGWIVVQFLAPTSTSVTTLLPTAPTNNSVVGMSFYVDARFSPSNVNSTVTATSGG